MNETRKRSIIKSITWRILATLTTMILVFIFTGNLVMALGIGFFEVISKMILYYFHERIWQKISLGMS